MHQTCNQTGGRKLALEQFKTQVLLLHSEQSALDVMSSGFDDDYAVHMARTGMEALDELGMTAIDVIISAQQLPGMSGLDALKEAHRRSPDIIGILLTGDQKDDTEALVGDQEVFQIVRGEISPGKIRQLVDSATRKIRLTTLGQSANDNAADVDQPGEHIVMETTSPGDNLFSATAHGTNAPQTGALNLVPNFGTQNIDLLILTRDEEFLATIKESARGLHNIRHATDVEQAWKFVDQYQIGVLVTDSAIVGADAYELTSQLRTKVPRLVAVVAGRRDDGEMLMDLINQGQVYRFLLKPISAGRARLAIEASVKQHLEAPDAAFAPIPKTAAKAKPAVKVRKPKKPAAPRKPIVIPFIKAILTGVFSLLARTAKMAGKALSIFSIWILQALTVLAAVLKKTALLVKARPKVALTATSTVLVAMAITWLWNNWDTIIPKSDPAPMTATVTKIGTSNLAAVEEVARDTSPIDQPSGIQESEPAVGEVTASTQLTAAPDQPSEEVAVTVGAGSSALAINVDIDPELAAAARQDQMGSLLALANQKLAENNLIAPHADNARYYFEQALDQDSNNAAAKQGLVMVSELLLNMANTAIKDDRLKDADELLAEARQTSVANNRLVSMEQQLSSAWENRFAANDLQSPESASADNAAATPELIPELNVSTSTAPIPNTQSNLESRIATYQAQLEDLQLRFTAQHPDVIALKQTIANLESQSANVLPNQNEQPAADPVAVIPASTGAAAGLETTKNDAETATEAVDSTAIGRPTTVTEDNATSLVENSQASAGIIAETVSAQQTALALVAIPTPQEITESNPVLEDVEKSPIHESSAKNGAAVNKEMPSNAVTTNAKNELAPPATPAAKEPVDDVTTAPYISSNELTRTQYKAPVYPRGAARRKLSGWVQLMFVVNTAGSVEDIRIMASEPSEIFNDAAIKSLSGWTYEPVVKNDQKIKVQSTIRIAFAFD